MRMREVSISVTGNQLTIEGERKREAKEKGTADSSNTKLSEKCRRIFTVTLYTPHGETVFYSYQRIFHIMLSVYYKVTLLRDIIKRQKIVLLLQSDGPRGV